jgi:hypothetical protein
MKKILSLSVFVFLLISSNLCLFAESRSSFNLSLYDGANFTVTFNDKVISEPTDEVEFNELQAGKYYLKVIKETINMPATPNIIFSDYIEITEGYMIFAVIDQYGKLLVYKKINNLSDLHQNHKHFCNCDCEYCRNCIYKTGTRKTEDNNDCTGSSMNEKDFKDVLKIIAEKPFENSKLEIAKQIVEQNILTSEQVRDLLKTFTFEDSKVNIAEYAYSKTCDKNNYFKIYNLFIFDSNIQMIKDYISNKK